MEKHISKITTQGFEPTAEDDLRECFSKAYGFTKSNYSDILDEIGSKSISKTSKSEFFREYIWVVHATGFSAKAVSKFLDRLFEAYGQYETLSIEDSESVVERVRGVVNNPQKIIAVCRCAKLLTSEEWEDWGGITQKWEKNIELLAELPYIGTTTMYHLGRNIGMKDLVKPDLHLIRMADHFHQESPKTMCEWIRKNVSEATSLDLGLIDLCLWYYASTFGTLTMKTGDLR